MKKFYSFLATAFFLCSTSLLHAQIISAAGAGGNYTIANYPGNFTGYYDGFSVVFRANHNSPGASTMNVNGMGAIAIINTAGLSLAANDIKVNQVVTIVYSAAGSQFQMITTSGNVSAGGGISGSGTAGRVAVFATASSLGNSVIYENAANIGVGVSPSGTYKFEVAGLVGSTGINETSDLRYKKNIFTLENSLQKVLSLRGVNYDWRSDEFKEKNFVSTTQIGLIAQEVEKIIPQVVNTDAAGFKSVEYSKLVALLIEAIKEQQEKIQSLQLAMGSLQTQNQTLAAEKEKEMQAVKAEIRSLHEAVDKLLKENVSLTTGQK